jgi:hypothetical protein
MQGDGDERFADWIDGQMTPRERERFEAEMRVSKPLRERAEAYRRTAQSVGQAFSQPMVKIDVADAVLARIQNPSSDPSRVSPMPIPRSLPSAWWRSGLVAAAMLLLMVALDRWQPSATLQTATLDDTSLATKDKRQESESKSEDRNGGLGEPANAEPMDVKLRAYGSATNTKAGRADRDAAAVGQEQNAPEALRLKKDAAIADLHVLEADGGSASPAGSAGLFGAPAPPVDAPKTMVPRVVLRRLPDSVASKSAEAREKTMPRGAAPAAGSAPPDGPVAGLLAGLAELDKTLGSLQVQRLPAVPGDLGRIGGESRGASPTIQAWLIEGRSADVYAFLGRLSDTGRSHGYEVTNGEIAMAEVLAFKPASKLEQEPVAEVDGARAKSVGRVAAADREAAVGETAVGEAAPVGSAGRPSTGPTSPSPIGATQGGGAGSMANPMSATMRLVIVIDSGSK